MPSVALRSVSRLVSASVVQEIGEALQVQRPAVAGGDAVAQALPAVAVAVEVAMLELDAGAVGAFGDRAHQGAGSP